MTQDVYNIMIRLTDEMDVPINIDLTNFDDLKTSLASLRADLVNWANRVKLRFDECKQINYPDFQEDPNNPALICSLVHTNSFMDYIKKIDDLTTGLIIPLEQSISDNRY